jgi:hypothetical protein
VECLSHMPDCIGGWIVAGYLQFYGRMRVLRHSACKANSAVPPRPVAC